MILILASIAAVLFILAVIHCIHKQKKVKLHDHKGIGPAQFDKYNNEIDQTLEMMRPSGATIKDFRGFSDAPFDFTQSARNTYVQFANGTDAGLSRASTYAEGNFLVLHRYMQKIPI